MATTPEKKVKIKVTSILQKAGAYFFMPATHGYGSSGTPDIVGCYSGVFFAIECKAGKNMPTALQVKNLNQIAAAGGYTAVVNEENLHEVENMLKRITHDKNLQQVNG